MATVTVVPVRRSGWAGQVQVPGAGSGKFRRPSPKPGLVNWRRPKRPGDREARPIESASPSLTAPTSESRVKPSVEGELGPEEAEVPALTESVRRRSTVTRRLGPDPGRGPRPGGRPVTPSPSAPQGLRGRTAAGHLEPCRRSISNVGPSISVYHDIAIGTFDIERQ